MSIPSDAREPIVEIDGLAKTFRSRFGRADAVQAVRNLSLRVERGSVVAFVGPNGAGKTTTIYALLGLLRPDRGTIRLFGQPAGSVEARRRTGFQSEIFYTYGFKTAASALRFYGQLAEMPDAKIADAVPRSLERLGLTGAANRKVAGFSKGMTQRLGLAQALLHEPELLVLDEPTTGLDPEGRKLVADIILEEKARGTTIFLSSHILSDVERTCDHVVILNRGSVAFSDSMDNLRRGSDAWEIEVLAWTPDARAVVAGLATGADGNAGEQIVEGVVSTVRCPGPEYNAVLQRLLTAGATIGAARRVHSLEDLYLEHAGGSSSG